MNLNTEIEAAWDAELERRAGLIRSGTATGETAEQVFAELRQRFASGEPDKPLISTLQPGVGEDDERKPFQRFSRTADGANKPLKRSASRADDDTRLKPDANGTSQP